MYTYTVHIHGENVNLNNCARIGYLPTSMMSRAEYEVRQVLNQMKGTHLLMARVMSGGGLRLMECLRLRVMGLDFAKSQVYVRGKGGKDRLTTLPPSIYDDLKAHLLRVKRIASP